MIWFRSIKYLPDKRVHVILRLSETTLTLALLCIGRQTPRTTGHHILPRHALVPESPCTTSQSKCTYSFLVAQNRLMQPVFHPK